MGSFITMALFALSGLFALRYPPVGIGVAYLVGVLNPQALWWWNFEDIRPVYWILLPTLIGAVFLAARGELRWEAVKNIRVASMLVLVITGYISWMFGPYVSDIAADGELGMRGAAFMMENLTKIVALAILAIMCIRTGTDVKIMVWVLMGSGLYLTWWINDRYLFHGAWGRIGGPISINGSGTYVDENVFATLFVAVFPFVWYVGGVAKNVVVRAGAYLAVPFVWHAVFLTGSRGALIALAASMLVIVVRMRKLAVGLGLIGVFVIAFTWQAGDTMKERLGGMDGYSQDASASGRIDAWEAGAKMMLEHPLTGIGPGAFVRAFPNFSNVSPLQAHNTYVQFGAEFGPIALGAFLILVSSCIRGLWKIPPLQHAPGASPENEESSWREATLTAMIGVSICAVFLSLQLFEVFYFLVALASILIVRSEDARLNQTTRTSRGVRMRSGYVQDIRLG